MIDPIAEDIGRAVIYVEKLQTDETRSVEYRYKPGVITSFNDICVFVNYGRLGTTSACTKRTDLEWGWTESLFRRTQGTPTS